MLGGKGGKFWLKRNDNKTGALPEACCAVEWPYAIEDRVDFLYLKVIKLIRINDGKMQGMRTSANLNFEILLMKTCASIARV